MMFAMTHGEAPGTEAKDMKKGKAKTALPNTIDNINLPLVATSLKAEYRDESSLKSKNGVYTSTPGEAEHDMHCGDHITKFKRTSIA